MSETAAETAAGGSVIAIDLAGGAADMAEIRALFLEYADFLGFPLCFQGFDEELAALPGFYAPPEGRLWLARVGGAVAGCVGLRPYGDGVCEIKRLYLRPAFRSLGLGRRLSELAVAAAEQIGYRVMRLDTVPKLKTAIALYRDMGFMEVEGGRPEPDGAPDGLLIFEKQLAAGRK